MADVTDNIELDKALDAMDIELGKVLNVIDVLQQDQKKEIPVKEEDPFSNEDPIVKQELMDKIENTEH